MIRTNHITTTTVVTCDEPGCTMCFVRDRTSRRALERELLTHRGWTKTGEKSHRCPHHTHVSSPSPAAAARLARAVTLTVQPLGGGRYRVTGGSAPHVVTVRGDRTTCDCPDHSFRRNTCKHLLAVALVLANDGERAAIANRLGL